jgi:hypothetical protein
VGRELYASVKDLPLVCPHGHVPPALLADPEAIIPEERCGRVNLGYADYRGSTHRSGPAARPKAS